jgi:acyl carrier protein
VGPHPDEIERVLIAAIMQLGGVSARPASETALRDLGIDSLDLTELAALAQEELGARFTGEDLGRIRTVADLLKVARLRAVTASEDSAE